MANGSVHGAPREREAVVRPSERAESLTITRRLRELVAREPFVFLVPAIAAVVLSRWLPNLVRQDTWLALVSGRLVWTEGPPDRDTLTIWPAGAEWVDQQWLGQLAIYGLHAAGGFRLLGLVHIVVVVAAFALALALAVVMGATGRSAALVGGVALFVAVGNTVVRTQAFAYLLFVLVFWLLASDARAPSRRVLLVLPVLALWANIHGSVLLGAGLVALWALAGIVRGFRARSALGAYARFAGIAVVAVLCLVASPYAFDLPGYYADVLGAGSFRDLVSEWRPATLPDDWPFFVLALPSLWLVARSAQRLTLFEQLALLFTFLGALDAIRNIVWFALAAMIVVPRALDDAWTVEEAPIRERVNTVLSLAAVAVTVGSVAVAAAHSGDWYGPDYPRRAAMTIADAAAGDPALRIFANERYADWLLWEEPALAGRVAFDARFELLTDRQLRAIGRFRSRTGESWRAAAAGYPLLVLDPGDERLVIRSLLREPGASMLYRDEDVAVIRRRAG